MTLAPQIPAPHCLGLAGMLGEAEAAGAYAALDYKATGFTQSLRADTGSIRDFARAYSEAGFLLEHLTCVDHLATESSALRLVYQFNQLADTDRHLVFMDVAPAQPVPSIADLFPGANWLEREVLDMFGVRFSGHPDPRRLLLPTDADYYPLLKSFDGGSQASGSGDACEFTPGRASSDPDAYYLNMGPQHPSMHGVLRIKLHMRGESILNADPDIGYAHRAHEKMAENRDYSQFLPNTSRIDYLSGMIYNLAYCQAIEKLLKIEVPERAEYLRTIAAELNRISSHLLWLGTFLLDLGGVTPFLYCFDDREQILDLLEAISGSRLTYCNGRVGGLTLDCDDDFLTGCLAFCRRLRERMPDYDKLVEGNVILRKRCEGVGVMDASLVRDYAVTGPCLRAMGIAYDVRRAEPYGIYDRFEFEIPTYTGGDCFDRFRVRLREMEQSLRIVEQAVAKIPTGPIMAAKVPKTIKPPAGESYFAVESARGQFGMYLVSDGSATPLRHKLRTPSFAHLSTMPHVLRGTMVADTIAIVGSIDIVLPEVDR